MAGISVVEQEIARVQVAVTRHSLMRFSQKPPFETQAVASFSEAAIGFVTFGLDFLVVAFFELELTKDFLLIAIVMTSKAAGNFFVANG